MALKELEAKLPQIGQVISNGSLGQIFKVANMGGMRYTCTYHVLVLISNHAMKMANPVFNPFDDKWIDGIFYYTGMGNVGDQPNPPTNQNKRLMNQDYYACYLFEVFRQGEFTYQGRVDLAGAPLYGGETIVINTTDENGIKREISINGRQPDKNGKMRDVWIFPIKRVNETGLRENKNDNIEFDLPPYEDKNKFLGAIGIAMSNLMPDGIIAAGGEHVRATAYDKFIDKGATVRVVGVRDSRLIVSEIIGL